MTVWLGAAAAVPKCALQLKCKLKCMPRTLGLLIDALWLLLLLYPLLMDACDGKQGQLNVSASVSVCALDCIHCCHLMPTEHFKVLMWQDKCRSLLGGGCCCCCRAINRDSHLHQFEIIQSGAQAHFYWLHIDDNRPTNPLLSPLSSSSISQLYLFAEHQHHPQHLIVSWSHTHTLRNTFTSTKLLLVCV